MNKKIILAALIAFSVTSNAASSEKIFRCPVQAKCEGITPANLKDPTRCRLISNPAISPFEDDAQGQSGRQDPNDNFPFVANTYHSDKTVVSENKIACYYNAYPTWYPDNLVTKQIMFTATVNAAKATGSKFRDDTCVGDAVNASLMSNERCTIQYS